MKLVDTFWFNAAWFQATWFCCVLGREPWVPVALLSLALHFYLVSDRLLEFRRLLPVAMVGIGVDVVLTLTGVFDFDSATIVPPLVNPAVVGVCGCALSKLRQNWTVDVVGSGIGRHRRAL